MFYEVADPKLATLGVDPTVGEKLAPVNQSEERRRSIALGGVTVVALALLAFQFSTANRGLDFVDESFSLSLASQPKAALNGGDVFLYGFLAHPLYAALGGDIALYRIAGLILIISVAAWLAIEVHQFLRSRDCSVSKPVQITVALVCSAATLPAFTQRSLGYRTLTLLGLMVAVAGLLRVSRGHAVLGGSLVGMAWVLTFTAKPTSAAALVVASAVFLISSRVSLFRPIWGMLAGVTLGLVGLISISELSVVEAYEFLDRGYRQVSAYDSYQSVWAMLGIWNVHYDSLRAAHVLGLAILIPVGVVWPVLRSMSSGSKTLGALTALAVGTLLATWLAVFGLATRGWANQVQPVSFLIPLAIVLVWIGRLRHRSMHQSNRGGTSVWPVVLLLLTMPYVASVGTNTLFAYNMAQACVFWVLALSALILGTATSESRRRELTALGMGFACCLVALGLFARFANGGPGRSEYSADRLVPVAGGYLKLNERDAHTLGVLDKVRRSYHLGPSLPSIDLTGFGSPGYQFQMGTRPLGRATYYGFFGAMEAAKRGLGSEPCAERARAWLLYAPDNPYDISPVHTGGRLDLTADYRLVATFEASQGGDHIRNVHVQILRPTIGVRAKLGC